VIGVYLERYHLRYLCHRLEGKGDGDIRKCAPKEPRFENSTLEQRVLPTAYQPPLNRSVRVLIRKGNLRTNFIKVISLNSNPRMLEKGE